MKYLTVLVLSALLAACGKSDFDIPGQQATIERYLTSKREEFTEQSGVYKYTFYNKNKAPVANIGDSVYFYFTGYTFNGSLGAIYTTNIASDTVGTNIDSTFLDFTPRKIKIGNNNFMQGIDLGIPGSAVADSMMLFITSDLAYGDKRVGVVPKGSTVAFKIVIDKIIK